LNLLVTAPLKTPSIPPHPLLPPAAGMALCLPVSWGVQLARCVCGPKKIQRQLSSRLDLVLLDQFVDVDEVGRGSVRTANSDTDS
jgi:hypothetical protein